MKVKNKEIIGSRQIDPIDLSQLKRELILFDRISFPPQFLSALKIASNHDRSLFNLLFEIEWLYEHGLLFEFNMTDLKLVRNTDPNKCIEILDIMEKSVKEILSNLKKLDRYLIDETAKDLYTDAFRARANANVLRYVYPNSEVIPIVSNIKFPLVIQRKAKENVLGLVLKRMPIPDEMTPWETILEFRNDIESRTKLLALRNWISDVARARLSESEIEEKLEYLLYSYQKYMELHKLKFKKGILEIFVTTSAEFIEDISAVPTLKFNLPITQLISIY